MNVPNPEVIPAVRCQIDQALEKIRIACKELRQAGWEENANDLMRSHQHLAVWTMKDGWLDHLEKPDAVPSDR